MAGAERPVDTRGRDRAPVFEPVTDPSTGVVVAYQVVAGSAVVPRGDGWDRVGPGFDRGTALPEE